jgi:flavorubredoxin
MRLHRHLSRPYLTNTYLVGPEEGGPAIIVDPGAIDVDLLQLIENRHYDINAIFVTTPKKIYTNGIKTLLKIYNADIYMGGQTNNDFQDGKQNLLLRSIYVDGQTNSNFQIKTVREGDRFKLNGFSIEIFSAPMMFSCEKVMYKIENFIFSGEIISAGMIYTITDPVIRQSFSSFLTEKENFHYLREDTPLFPGSGPPTTIELEKNLIQEFLASERPDLLFAR